MATHTITLHRNDDRMSDKYGQHYYVERINGTRVKVEYLDWKAYDREHAYVWASAVAKLYGGTMIDRRPPVCLYGWSAD